ncbi:MAG: MarR family transcriptional regulator [candidate division Zixibacteria bacterium]|nr:MarR family transcriptional regulator [candidate division Zixibacteria bacterium]
MEKKRDMIEGIGRVWLLLRRFGRKKISELDTGLTFDQMLVLFTLYNNEGMKIGDIADLTDRDRTTTSRMISGLEKKNLILRVPGHDDNRQKLIYLTRSAKDLLEGLEPLKKEFERTMFKGIKKADMDKVAKMLNKVADNLE